MTGVMGRRHLLTSSPLQRSSSRPGSQELHWPPQDHGGLWHEGVFTVMGGCERYARMVKSQTLRVFSPLTGDGREGFGKTRYAMAEVGVCVALEPHGLGEGGPNACVMVVACTVVGTVAVGCSWARFTAL